MNAIRTTTAAVLLTLSSAAAQLAGYEDEVHGYFTSDLHDSCTELDLRLASGALQLSMDNDREMLRQLLRETNVPEQSQVLVFSKTSLQKDRITPWNPRALYFNEETYIGWVPGGIVELAGMDPQLGPVFYSLDPGRTDRKTPRLDRADSCMDCHGGAMTNGVPGVFVRSVFPDRDGSPMFEAGTALIDYTSPIEARWGGWYVTGTHGTMRHMGNVIATSESGTVSLDRNAGANITSLEQFFPVDRYLCQGSDIVALMVLEHQVAMHSRIVEAAYDLRAANARHEALVRELGADAAADFTGSSETIAESHAEKILKCLLFVDEAPMPKGGIEGDAGFQDAFRENRIRDSRGRSLKDFQLLKRIFKYRCSYMIYSRSFDGLPDDFKARIYAKLRAILAAPAAPAGYTHLSDSERANILRILEETRSGFPKA